MGQLCILSSGYLIESVAWEALKKAPPGLCPQRCTVNWSEVGPRKPCFFKSPPADSNEPLEWRPTHLAETVDIHQKTEWDIFTSGAHTVITNIYWVSFLREASTVPSLMSTYLILPQTLVVQMVKNLLQCGRPRFDPWVRNIPLKKYSTPVFLPGELHGQRSLAGYSP